MTPARITTRVKYWHSYGKTPSGDTFRMSECALTGEVKRVELRPEPKGRVEFGFQQPLKVREVVK